MIVYVFELSVASMAAGGPMAGVAKEPSGLNPPDEKSRGLQVGFIYGLIESINCYHERWFNPGGASLKPLYNRILS